MEIKLKSERTECWASTVSLCPAGLLMVFLSGYLIEVTQSWASVYTLLVLVNSLGLTVYLLFGDARRIVLDSYSPVLVV